MGRENYFLDAGFYVRDMVNLIMKKMQGFTLMEMVVAMTIMLMLIALVVSSMNPWGVLNKGQDATRKKDLKRLSVAFEEYSNDHDGCYPTSTVLAGLACNSDDFAPWLQRWPCDPDGSQYYIVVDDVDCPRWFKILTNLDNVNDADILEDWYDSFRNVGGGGVLLPSQEVNYGVSSTNLNWYEYVISSTCSGICSTDCGPSGCQSVVSCDSSTPGGCYADNTGDKAAICVTDCCGPTCSN